MALNAISLTLPGYIVTVPLTFIELISYHNTNCSSLGDDHVNWLDAVVNQSNIHIKVYHFCIAFDTIHCCFKRIVNIHYHKVLVIIYVTVPCVTTMMCMGVHNSPLYNCILQSP